MRFGVLLLLSGLSAGCTGSDAPSSSSARPGAPEQGTSTPTTPASTTTASGEPIAGEPGADEPVGLRCTGTVVSAQESPQNKRFPDRGGHWIVELEIEEWSAADDSEQPPQPLRLIVPKEVVAGLANQPAVGDRLAVIGKLLVGRTDTARVDSISPVEPTNPPL